MVTLSKIYTRTGDEGSTGLVGGERVKKNSLRVESYGDIDELNSHLGLCVTLASEVKASQLLDILTIIQNELFDMGSELASPGSKGGLGVPVTDSSQVTRLEQWIDELNKGLPSLQSFVLPGGTMLNAHLHIARCVCRRAERTILSLHDCEPVPAPLRHYVNRLSDLLFVMSRYASVFEGKKELLWIPGGSRSTARP